MDDETRTPTQACLEWAMPVADAASELFENSIIEDAIAACRAARSPRSYTAFRRLLITRPVLTATELAALAAEIDLMPVFEVIRRSYEPAPAAYLSATGASSSAGGAAASSCPCAMAATAASLTAAEMTAAPPWVLCCRGHDRGAPAQPSAAGVHHQPRARRDRPGGGAPEAPASAPRCGPSSTPTTCASPSRTAPRGPIDVKDWANPSLLGVRTRALRATRRTTARSSSCPPTGSGSARTTREPSATHSRRNCTAISRSAPTRTSPGSPGASSAGSTGHREQGHEQRRRRTEGMTMRSSNGWHLALSRELTDVWPQDLGGFPPAAMLAVELGLYLLGRVMPGRPGQGRVDPLRRLPVRGGVRPCPDGRAALAIRRARHYLWTMRRRRVWLTHLERYARSPGVARLPARRPRRRPGARSPARAAARFERFEDLLSSPPEFTRRDIPLATAGQYLVPGPGPQSRGHHPAGVRRRASGAGA